MNHWISLSYIMPDTFLIDEVAARFEVLLRRYQLISRDVPVHFQQWLRSASAQKRVFASFDSICADMFPEQFSVCPDQPWMLAVATVALKQHVLRQTGLGVELSACGRALRVVDRDVAARIPVVNEADSLLQEAVCSASRIAALEVHAARLEAGILDEGERKRAKHMRPPADRPELVLAYLAEGRLEALDALAALRKAQSIHRRQSESTRMMAANAEIARLQKEISKLKGETASPSAQHRRCVLPKRVLSLAGFWNLTPNDLLHVTPALVQTVEARGGEVIRREGLQVSFSDKDKALLVDAAVETMSRVLPQYIRRTEY